MDSTYEINEYSNDISIDHTYPFWIGHDVLGAFCFTCYCIVMFEIDKMLTSTTVLHTAEPIYKLIGQTEDKWN